MDGELEIVWARMEIVVLVLSERLGSSQARLIFVSASGILIASEEVVLSIRSHAHVSGRTGEILKSGP